MRVARFSVTAEQQLLSILEQGGEHYSSDVLLSKYKLVSQAVRIHLTLFPEAHPKERDRGLHLFPVPKTPFVLAYNFDEEEVRIHFVLHRKENRNKIDLDTITW